MKNKKVLLFVLVILTLMMCFLSACKRGGDSSSDVPPSDDASASVEPSVDENPFQFTVPSKETQPSTQPIIQPSVLPEPSYETPSLEEPSEEPPPVCDCEWICMENDKKEDCPVCSLDMTKCTGAERDPLDLIALPSGQTTTASIISFGNNTVGNAVLNAAKKGDKYDFNYMYEHLKDTIKEYDVRIVSQSSIFTYDANDYSGTYNAYITPTSAGDALIDAGFNVIAQASGSAFVEGKNGINNTLNFWKQYPNILVTGIHATQQAADTIPMADVNGIRIAFLNYTANIYGANLTSAERHLIKTLSDEDKVAAEIREATRIADFVIVLPNWCMGTTDTPSANQKKWVKIFADNGADLIIGSGVSSIQPIELLVSKSGQIVPCYYSLGNCMAGATSLNEIVGGAATIEIQKTGKTTTIKKYNFLPTFTHFSKKGDFYQTYMIEDYADAKIEQYHYFQKHDHPFVLKDIRKQLKDGIKIKDISKMLPGGGLQPVNPNNPDYENFNPNPSTTTGQTQPSTQPSSTPSETPSSSLSTITIT